MTKVIVFGGKGTAVNVAEHILDARARFNAPVELQGYAIDDPALGDAIGGIPIVARTRDAAAKFPQAEVKFLFCLYKPDRMRERVHLRDSFGIDPGRYATFVHPSAYVAPSAKLSPGVVILSQSAVQSNCSIGPHCIVNSNVVIEHDARLEGSAFVAAHVSIGAHCILSEGVFVGLNASIRENVRVGSFCFVGMAANVLRDVDAHAPMIGNPARPAR